MRKDRRVQRSNLGAWIAATTLAIFGLLGATALLSSERAQAQLGVGGGETTAATIIIGDATAEPGGAADVTVSLETDTEASGVQVDIVYNGDDASIDNPATACSIADRLDGGQQLSASFPDDQPEAPSVLLRLGVIPPFVFPNPTFGSGDLATCVFTVSSSAMDGDTIPLEAALTQVAVDDTVICGRDGPGNCGEVDGVISVGSGDTPTPEPTETPTPIECETDDDCDFPEQCVAGMCVDRPCDGDDDCPDGSECETGNDGATSGNGGGVCVIEDCETDLDCDLNEQCNDGRCEDIPCTGPEDCPLGTNCGEDDTCKQIPCEMDNDCPSGTTCVDGYCEPPCRSDADCPDGRCLDFTCVECITASDCDDDQECLDNVCVDLPAGSLTVTGGSGVPGGAAVVTVALIGISDGAITLGTNTAESVANTLTLDDINLAIAACTAAGEISGSFEGTGTQSVSASLTGTIPAGDVYACDVSIGANTVGGAKIVRCSNSAVNGQSVACSDGSITVEVANTPTPPPDPTDTPTQRPTVQPTLTPIPPTNTPSRGSGDDDGCAVVAPTQSGTGSFLLLLLAPVALLWGRRSRL